MKPYLIITLLILAVSNFVNALNILSVLPYHGKSHFFVFKALLTELTNRGHDVTVISHFPDKNSSKNYHDISLAGSIKIVEDDFPLESSYWTLLKTAMYLSSTGQMNCDVMLRNQDVQSLVKKKRKFDVILVEQFNSDCALGLAYKIGAPVVALTSHILMPWHYQRFGIPENPSYVSYHFLHGGTKPSLFQRAERVIFDVYFKTTNYLAQRSDQDTVTKYLGDVPPLEELARQTKFMLLYHNFVLTGSQLFPANVIEVGGYHVAQAKLLTGDLKEFVDKAEHGVIYISFGSVVKSATMPADKVEAVLGAMRELPQRFIWKWEDETLLVDKDKVFISSWLPQSDILAHPKTLAFFSHAGMLGTTEGIHFGVPVVAMPILGDQPANAAAVQESGLGVQLLVADLTTENLLAAFKKVLDPKFRENVKKISKAWHDRPISPMDSAVYWIQFAARHPNLRVRSAAADVPFYQYLYLDIGLIFISVASVLTWLFVSVCCGKKKVVAVKKKGNKSKRE